MDFSRVNIPSYEELWNTHADNMARIAAEKSISLCTIHNSKWCPCVQRKSSHVYNTTFDDVIHSRPIFQLTSNPFTKKRKHMLCPPEKCQTCAICLKNVNRFQRYLANVNCDHIFHHGCISTWIDTNSTCPLCRKEYVPIFD